jgi:hypothetical protein
MRKLRRIYMFIFLKKKMCHTGKAGRKGERRKEKGERRKEKGEREK